MFPTRVFPKPVCWRFSAIWNHGRQKGDLGSTPGFWKLQHKKVVFAVSSGKKQISPLFPPLAEKFWKNPLLPPPREKILPISMPETRILKKLELLLHSNTVELAYFVTSRGLQKSDDLGEATNYAAGENYHRSSQVRNQLRTPGGAKSFLRGAQIFWTVSNSFKLCPTNFSREGEYFSRGAFSPLVTGLEARMLYHGSLHTWCFYFQ